MSLTLAGPWRAGWRGERRGPPRYGWLRQEIEDRQIGGLRKEYGDETREQLRDRVRAGLLRRRA
jgi:hypothetical protein